MESAREEGAPEEHITVFNKILKHAFDIMALYSMSPKQVDKWKNWKTHSRITRVALGSDRNFLLVAYRIHTMLDQIVENLDDIEIIGIQMWKQSLSHWYVNKPNFRQHSEVIYY